MYGLVNHGIQCFVTRHHGAETWREVCAAAGLKEARFEAGLSYDDAITHRLVAAISDRLGSDAGAVLELFGAYWPSYARTTAIGRLFDFGGSTFVEFLDSLDEMHDRMTMSLPDLRPPSFEVELREERRFILHYRSERDGLAPMVVGMLHGLARDYGETIRVAHVVARGPEAGHDQFEIEVLAPPARTEAA